MKKEKSFLQSLEKGVTEPDGKINLQKAAALKKSVTNLGAIAIAIGTVMLVAGFSAIALAQVSVAQYVLLWVLAIFGVAIVTAGILLCNFAMNFLRECTEKGAAEDASNAQDDPTKPTHND